jgi:hypothetical protein
MDEAKQRAYRFVLSAGLLHVKWDLACWYGGFDFWNWRRQARAARRASLRAFAFHNLAIHTSRDFQGFSEQKFWEDIELFRRDCPDALCPYREMFNRCLRGEPQDIIAPSGIGGA